MHLGKAFTRCKTPTAPCGQSVLNGKGSVTSLGQKVREARSNEDKKAKEGSE